MQSCTPTYCNIIKQDNVECMKIIFRSRRRPVTSGTGQSVPGGGGRRVLRPHRDAPPPAPTHARPPAPAARATARAPPTLRAASPFAGMRHSPMLSLMIVYEKHIRNSVFAYIMVALLFHVSNERISVCRE